MRIGFDPVPLGGFFGNSAYSTELIRALGSRYPGDTFIVPTYFFKGAAAKRLFPRQAAISIFPRILNPLMLGKGMRKRLLPLSRTLEVSATRGLYDCYHCTNPTLFNNCCERSIITIHDLIPLINEPSWANARDRHFYARQLPAVLEKCARIICDSQATRSSVLSFFPMHEQKIRLVPLAVGAQFRHRDVDRRVLHKYGFADSSNPFLLSVGVFSDRKNIPFFLSAFAALPEVVKKDVRIILTGNRYKNRPFPPIVNCLQNLGLADRVSVVPNLPQDALVDLYNLAHGLVFPSLHEGFGLPVLEAMACGCPVVTSGTTSLPEVAGEAALYIDPRTEASCTRALEQLLANDELRRGLSEKGLREARKFSWESTAQKTHAVYEEVCKADAAPV